jgi:adenylate cyclase
MSDSRQQRERAITRWLLTEGCAASGFVELIKGYTHRFFELGVPVDRVFLGSLVIHPQAAGEAVIYRREEDTIGHRLVSHDEFDRLNQTLNSPIRHMLEEGTDLRARLELGEDLDMPDLQGLRDEGYTDFVAIPVRVGRRMYAGATYCTRRPGGFSEDDLAVLHEANVALGPVGGFLLGRRVQSTLLQAYLGADAGSRVHAGQVRRGDGETIRAAVWFCDMRGFTRLSDEHPRDAVLALINDVFEVAVQQIQDGGGQVLKFLGDGMLAIFVDADSAKACSSALAAARGTQEGIAALVRRRQAEGQPATRLGIGLHYGDVMYGNIGAPGRLDFTVIGSAVNLSARIEGLCSGLERDILMSRDFADRVAAPVQSCGRHMLKGVDSAVEVLSCS